MWGAEMTGESQPEARAAGGSAALSPAGRLAAAIVALGDVMARMAQMNADPIGGTPADMAKFIKQERERWSTVIRNTGVKPE